MGQRDMPRYWPTRRPLVRWGDIDGSDLKEANHGQIELCRDVQVDGRPERHIGMLVVGQYERSLALGLVALRCERRGESLIPLTCSIPETPATVVPTPAPVPAQSNPRRRTTRHDDCDYTKGWTE